ncbi:unnamed protein product [Larinioides sclopetarius]|uniref:Prenylcysteine lyase domain-containing protein n=1 Tax=Larinioides sclopetarius TaxID=280406 RepID=A0AAV2AK48_9ARAC
MTEYLFGLKFSKMYKLIIGLFFCTLQTATCLKADPKIGIVGGGIGGTSCAYFLRDLFGEKTKITLFEKDSVGGRLKVLNVGGNYYEAGGAVIHPSNKHMVDFLRLLALRKKTYANGNKFGIFDGEKFVFQESDWTFITIADYIWRYGFSFFELWKEVKSAVEDFSRIYKLQDEEFAFTTVYGMLEHMNPGFRNLTLETLLSNLQKKSYPKRLLEELVQSITMVNYGQTYNISAFAGYIALAGADSNLWSVEGGNELIPSGLLARSKANLVSGEVVEIVLMSDGTYTVKYIDLANGTLVTEGYDIVVLASPLIKGQQNIKFTNFQKDFDQFESIYQRIVATFVKGTLNPSAFNVPSVPDDILTFKNNLLFNSIGKLDPVGQDGQNVYKIFSNELLSEKNIDTLFEDIDMYRDQEWFAYPHYDPPENLPPFYLYPNLFYINAIERAASAMEMSAVASKNVALLAIHMWYNNMKKIDQRRKFIREEL